MCVERPTAVISAVIGLRALANELASCKHARTESFTNTAQIAERNSK